MRFLGSTVEGRLAAFDRWRWRLPALALATAAATAAGLVVRAPFFLPLAQAAVAWPFFLASCAAGNPRRAAGAVLVFALAACAVVTAAVALGAEGTFDRAVWNGPRYRDEMLAFVRSGGLEGEEATPHLFIPKHALHFGAFVFLCLATAGFAALAMGAVLLDYMSYYVGACLVEAGAHGGDVARTLLFAWAPYAILRVVAYACAGSGLTTWLLGPAETRTAARRAVVLGIFLAVADVLAKAFLARWYGETLLSAIYRR